MAPESPDPRGRADAAAEVRTSPETNPAGAAGKVSVLPLAATVPHPSPPRRLNRPGGGARDRLAGGTLMRRDRPTESR
jgi:hypothetical protein